MKRSYRIDVFFRFEYIDIDVSCLKTSYRIFKSDCHKNNLM
jgi:hypothetical protein